MVPLSDHEGYASTEEVINAVQTVAEDEEFRERLSGDVERLLSELLYNLDDESLSMENQIHHELENEIVNRIVNNTIETLKNTDDI